MSRRPIRIAVTLLAAFSLTGLLAACGEEEKTEVVEGEPLELGELSYNVQITRFLNPDDNEDAGYLVEQPEAEPGTSYLGVFMQISNHSSEPLPSADAYTVSDTLDSLYEPLESTSPYALEIGSEVPAEGMLPLPDTTAQSGPNQGALLIFNVSDDVSENRPLKLEIEGDQGSGEVILDI